MSDGLTTRLRASLNQRADFADVLAGSWASLSSRELAERRVHLETDGAVALGEMFELKGEPKGRVRFLGDLGMADRLGAGMTEGEVAVEGNLGNETGLALAGGTMVIDGDVGARAGAAPLGFKRGMTGLQNARAKCFGSGAGPCLAK